VQVIYEGFFGVVAAESGLVSNLMPNYSPSLTDVCAHFLDLCNLLLLSSLPSNYNLLLPSFRGCKGEGRSS
jgi:hypothetical protein